MVHMPGHIWLIFGEWDWAADVNERAAEVDRHYFHSTGVTAGSYPMYFWHNLSFVLNLVRDARRAIVEGRYDAFRKSKEAIVESNAAQEDCGAPGNESE